MRHTARPSALLRLPAALVLLTALVLFSTTRAQVADTEAAESSPRQPPISENGTGSCQTGYEEIRKRFDGLPSDMGSVTPQEAERLSTEVQELVRLARDFEQRCGNGDPTELAEVRYVQARSLFLLSARFRATMVQEVRAAGETDPTDAIRSALRSYHGEVENLAQLAFDKLPDDHRYRPLALQLVGQSAAEVDELDAALRAYQRFVDLFPTDPLLGNVLLALARVHLDLGSYDLGIDAARRAQKEFFGTDVYPASVEFLWKLYHAKGDLTGMWQCVKTVDTVFPLKLESAKLSLQLKNRLNLFLEINGFREGYTLLARGDFEGSAKAFRRHLALMNTKPEASPPAKVYQQRSRDVLTFVEELAGRPFPADLELDWITGSRVRLADSKGKVVLLVFRGVGDGRSVEFLGPVWDFASADPQVEMAVISYLRPGETPEGQSIALRNELTDAGYVGPTGFDPDKEKKALFQAYSANVGSATFVIVAPDGNVVWFMQDPRGIDTDFAVALAKRNLPKDTEPKADDR